MHLKGFTCGNSHFFDVFYLSAWTTAADGGSLRFPARCATG